MTNCTHSLIIFPSAPYAAICDLGVNCRDFNEAAFNAGHYADQGLTASTSVTVIVGSGTKVHLATAKKSGGFITNCGAGNAGARFGSQIWQIEAVVNCSRCVKH